MADETHSVRFGVYLDRDLVDRCDAALPKTNAGSRSELIADAVRFYLAWLDTEDYSKVLTPALESVIDARIKTTEKISERFSSISRWNSVCFSTSSRQASTTVPVR